MFRCIFKLSNISQLLLIIFLHFFVVTVVWTTKFPDKDYYAFEYILSAIHLLFSVMVIFLFYINKSHHFWSVRISIVALLLLIISNCYPTDIAFDSWLGNSYREGYGWPFTFYEFNPFDWVRSDFPEYSNSKWTINNLHANIYFSSISIAFLMLIFDKRMNRNQNIQKII